MIRFIYSAASFAAKPTERGVIAGLQKPYNYIFAEVESISNIAALIGEGRAWRAGLYDDGIDSFKKANVKGAQILALDFDNCEYEPLEVIQYAEGIGIAPSAWYYSYSQGIKSGNNFRVLWVLEKPLKNIQYETIYGYMLEQFKAYGPDNSTRDASRLWFGTGIGVNVLCNEPIKLSAIGWLGVCDKLRENQKTEKVKKAVKGCEKDFYEEPEIDLEPLYIDQKKDWKGALTVNCYLWDKWSNGKYLNYNERLTLFTNLKYLKYGNNNISVLKDVIEMYYSFESTYEGHSCNEEQIRRMFKTNTLHAVGIVRVAGHDRLLTVKEYFQLENKSYANPADKDKVSLEELDSLLKTEMPKLLGDDKSWYIKSQTASGKTYHVIQWLLKQDLTKKKIVYSAPRYTNLDEFKGRFIKAYNEYSGNKPLYDMDEVIKAVPRGRYSAKDLLLMELGFPPSTPQDERYSIILEMVNPDTKGLYLATHECIAHLRTCPADCIIIDENIENALITKTVIDMGGLSSIIPYLENKQKKDDVLNFIDVLKEGTRGEIVDISILKNALINFDRDAYITIDKPTAGIGKILEQQKEPPMITVKTSYVGKRKIENLCLRLLTKSTLIDDALKLGTPIKLLSATPKRALLTKMYDTDEIGIYNFPLAKNKGEIIQFTGITGRKGDNDKDIQKLIRYVKKHIPKEEIKKAYVLTFKSSIEQWEHAGFKIPTVIENGEIKKLHLSNNSGLDLLKGEVVIVAGKFDYNEDEYLDTYYTLHPNSKTMPNRVPTKITIASRTLTINLFNDDELREIQIENIRMYLEQSAGRARALREENAKVYLICDFPIADADIINEY